MPEWTIPIRTDTDAVAAHAVARRTAARAGFCRDDQMRIAIATSELATNIAVHAGGGVITIREVYGPGDAVGSLEIVARDDGPGILDVEAALRDGSNTPDTRRGLGAGLGGVRRLMDEIEISSRPGRGTTVIARKHLGACCGR